MRTIQFQSALIVALFLFQFACAMEARSETGNTRTLQALLPPKILSIYGGYAVDRDEFDTFDETVLARVKDARFNCIDVKILAGALDLQAPAQWDRLAQLCQRSDEYGLQLMCYTYASAARPKDKDFEPVHFVDEAGNSHPNKYSFADAETFFHVFDSAFQLAQASTQLAIAAVKVDLESVNNNAISYDGKAWSRFAALHDLDAALQAELRVQKLDAVGLREVYETWFKLQVAQTACSFQQKMHHINPRLVLGMMPAHHGWFYEAFIGHLATADVPAVMDNWAMYNSNGFVPAVLAEQAYVKGLNRNNVFVPWLRLNNYYPDDVTVQSYQAVMKTDGYCSWTYTMISRKKSDLPLYLHLPGHCSAEQYWQAFARNNAAVHESLRLGVTDMIAHQPGRPVAPPIEGLDTLDIPVLAPMACSEPKDAGQWISLRDQQVIYVFAQSGESIDITIKHLAGQRRAVALNYVLIDRNGLLLRNETVAPGATEEFQVTAPRKDTYALVITGGSAGMAWYGVKVENPYAALKLPAYLFFMHPVDLWFAGPQGIGKGQVALTSNHNQVVAASWNGGPARTCTYKGALEFELPEGHGVDHLRLVRPDTLPEDHYVQDYLLSATGSAYPFACLRRGYLLELISK